MKFRDYFSLKHIIFAVVLIALMIVFAIRHANTLVRVDLDDTTCTITSAKYTIKVDYAEIESAELVPFVEDGNEKVANTFNDDLLRTGIWKNDTWGEYMMCSYLETEKCILLHLEDGTTVVFSHKSLKATTETYQQLLTYISAE